MGYNELGAEGAKHISEGLKANKALTKLEYAASLPFPYCQYPLTFDFDSRWQFVVEQPQC